MSDFAKDTNVPANDCISRQAAIDAIKEEEYPRESDYDEGYMAALKKSVWIMEKWLPSAQPEWNNHTVACLLAELFDDKCACNYNGIDEWLPEKCEVIDACPNPVGVACWEQYLAWKPCPEPYREDGAE